MTDTDHPPGHTLRYRLTQKLDVAVRALRDAEDMARLEMPAWPTADRIRSIYEQITADVLEGRTSIPPIAQRLRESEERCSRLGAALLCIEDADHEHGPGWFAEMARAALDSERQQGGAVIEIYKAANGQYRWRMFIEGNETAASPEGYASAEEARSAAEAFQADAQQAPITDEED